MFIDDLKKSILQKAIQGKLVEQNPNDEPASELLKRIREEKEKLIKDGKIKKEKSLSPITDEEKPFDIPNSWERVRVPNILYFQQGVQIDKGYQKTEKGVNDIEFLRIINFTQDLEDERRYVDKGFININSLVNKDCLIMARYGCVGKIFYGREGLLANNLFKINSIYNKISLDYIKLFFETDYAYFKLIGDHSDTALPSINFGAMNKLIFPLPPLEEQKRIVAKLDELMPLLDEARPLEEEITKLEKDFPSKLRQSILQYAIQGKLVEQNSGDEPASELLKKIKEEKEKLIKEGKIKKDKALEPIKDEEKLFDIPSNWEWVRLGEIVSLSSGNVYKETEHGKLYIKVADMNIPGNEYEITNSTRYVSENNYGEIPMYSIIFPKRGGAIATNKKRCVLKESIFVDSNTMAITAYLNDTFFYLKWWFESIDLSKLQNGGAIPQVNNKDISPLLIPLPPLEEQKRIVTKLDELMKLCDELEEKINSTGEEGEKLVDSVLQNIFRDS